MRGTQRQRLWGQSNKSTYCSGPKVTPYGPVIAAIPRNVCWGGAVRLFALPMPLGARCIRAFGHVNFPVTRLTALGELNVCFSEFVSQARRARRSGGVLRSGCRNRRWPDGVRVVDSDRVSADGEHGDI